jgi:hypothetical protein
LADFSDFIAFADESGDHGLDGIDPSFPMFGLAFCLIAKNDYATQVVPAFQQLKFDIWGHDGVVLHEHEIRKSQGAFGILRTDRTLREAFFERLNKLMEDAPIEVFASVINKTALKARYSTPRNPYEIALLFCMERLLASLLSKHQAGKLVHVAFESRGAKEDAQLELEFRRIADNKANRGYRSADFSRVGFEPVFMPKACNSIGLQLADLTARPIVLHFLRPNQPNRAFEILRRKPGSRKCFP